MKYNKRTIMNNAWKLRRVEGMTMSEALRMAWKIAKTIVAEKAVSVKSWFLSKKFNRSERYAIETARKVTVERETEKAVFVKWFTEFGTVSSWVPKSCLI